MFESIAVSYHTSDDSEQNDLGLSWSYASLFFKLPVY